MNAGVSLFDDAAARVAIENELDTNFIVEAAAGTGKTTELVRRTVALLKTGRTTVDRLVAVTFTRKAAGELKLRLRQHLDASREAGLQQRHDPTQISNLENAMARLEEARIGTIHSFCAELLRERPVEAGLDPGFEEMDEEQSRSLYERTFEVWIQQELSGLSSPLKRALARRFDESPLRALSAAGWALVEWRDFPAPWRTEPFDLERESAALVDAIRELAGMAGQCRNSGDRLRKTLQPAVEFILGMERAEATRPRDYERLEPLLVRLRRDLSEDKAKGAGPFATGLQRDQVVAARAALVDAIEQFRLRAEANLAGLLHEELRGLVERYESAKKRSGKLDFGDLLIAARNLIRGNREVRAFLQQRFSHILVDEFQDTDPLQAEILLLLAADHPDETDWRNVCPVPGKLFLVGDPKQAIYRFRRADVLLYQAVYNALGERRVQKAYLSRSFRAVEPIQRAINFAFSRSIQPNVETGQPGYVPLVKEAEAPAGQPSLIALPVPRPYGKARVSNEAIDRSLPQAIAGFLEWLVAKSGWTVRDPEQYGRRIPLEAGHVCLLFRRYITFGADVTRPYIESLEARGIPHVLVGARTFHYREEVETLRAALAAVEWPDDELSVFATLRGSLFAISDETLLRFKNEAGRLHPFRPRPAGLDPALGCVDQALTLLAELHRQRNRRPAADTLNRLLESTRAHAAFAFRPAGYQVLANVQRVVELARNFEMSGGISFRGFVERLEADAQREQTAGISVIEEGTGGVRLMTVHSAKGLEFPVVVLADITANIAPRRPDRYIDPGRGLCAVSLMGCAPQDLLDNQALESARDQAEGVRLAYVAATRARDLLVVPGVGDGPRHGWVEPLNAAIYPPAESWRKPRPAPGCPRFGNETVIERPSQAMSSPMISPGRHPMPGDYDVVWWDPFVLRLEVESSFGLRQEQILSGDSDDQAVSEGLRQYRAWQDAHARAVELGCRPKFDLLLASETPESPPGVRGLIAVETLVRDPGRPGGRRFGTLVHAVLCRAEIGAGAEAVRKLTRLHARTLGASVEEAEAAARVVTGALAHPLLRQAQAAERVYRELPLTVQVAAGRILEAAVDLAFVTGTRWTIVDFKTDADVLLHRPHHERQLGWYVYALARITNADVSACLLYV